MVLGFLIYSKEVNLKCGSVISYSSGSSSWASIDVGVRILVSLDASVKLSNKSVGTKKIQDPRNTENSWTYNVWNIE